MKFTVGQHMRIISFFDWVNLPIQEVLNCVYKDLAKQFEGELIGILTCDEKVYSSSNIQTLIKKHESCSGSVSIEIYADFVDENDPELGWESYFCYSSRLQGKRNCIISIKNNSIEKNEIVTFIKNVTAISEIGYGFSFDYIGKSDGRYYSQGISTGESSDIECEEDARWFNERINLKEKNQKHNRHLKGYFKDVFEINILNKHHLENIQNTVNGVTEILELGSGNILWMPNFNDIKQIKEQLQKDELII